MSPDEWLCAALSVGGAADNFRVLELKYRGSLGVSVRVLHKESGAVWVFTCVTDKQGAG